MSHTPGPWHTTDSIHNGKVYISSARNDRGKIALCQTEADAKLIAAAPDLLQALQDMVLDNGNNPTRMLKIAKAAIAKAIGDINV